MACFLRNSSTLLDAPTDWRELCVEGGFLRFQSASRTATTQDVCHGYLAELNQHLSGGRFRLYANVQGTDTGKARDLFGVQTEQHPRLV
jgi:hypothetical protein